jgi:hypothetical protein
MFKSGTKATQANAAHEKQIEDNQNRVFRFYLPDGVETKITFLDGSLNDDGIMVPMYWEHQLFQNGNWKNWYHCVQDEEPCPLCEGGDKSYLAVPLTIIDHTQWTDSSNKIHQHEKKLYVIKNTAQKLLTKQFKKREGLQYATFEVSREGAQSPNTGNQFEFIAKSKRETLVKRFSEDLILPANYEQAIPYMDAESLRSLGFGVNTVVGGEPQHSSNSSSGVPGGGNHSSGVGCEDFDDDIPF